MKNYKDLEIYQMAYSLAIDVHKMSLKLPNYELYEQGSQVRRSSKSIKDNIVEGYGRRKYKNEYLKFLIYAQSSCDETMSQIEMINDLHFSDSTLHPLLTHYDILGKKINSYIQYVEKFWNDNKI